MVKRVIPMVIGVVILLSVFCGGYTIQDQKELSSEGKAINGYNSLLNSFGTSSQGDFNYDNAFAGGSFSNGKLTVYVQRDHSDVIESYQSIVNNPDILFEPVNYSLKELLMIQAELMCFAEDYKIMLSSISYPNNTVRLRCLSDSPLFESPGLIHEFEEAVEVLVFEGSIEFTSLHGGDESTTCGTTIGWCGTYSGLPSVITCGHGNYSHQSISVHMEDTNSSTTVSKEYTSIENPEINENTICYPTPVILGDYFFGTVDNSGLTTNDFHSGSYGSLIDCNSYIPSLPANSPIKAYGKNSYGLIAETTENYGWAHRSFTVWVNGIPVFYDTYGLVLANFLECTSQEGDSGGPVYYEYIDSSGVVTGTGATGTITARTGNGSILMFSPLRFAVAHGFAVRTW